MSLHITVVTPYLHPSSVWATARYIYAGYESHNKQRLFPYAASTRPVFVTNTQKIYCNNLNFCTRYTWSACHRLLSVSVLCKAYNTRDSRGVNRHTANALQLHELSWHNNRYYYKTGSFLYQQRVYFSVNIRWHLFEYSQLHGRLPNRHSWLCILGLALDQLSRSLDSCYLLFFHNLMTLVFVFFVYYYVAISFLAWSDASIVSAVSRQSNECDVYLASGRIDCRACTASYMVHGGSNGFLFCTVRPDSSMGMLRIKETVWLYSKPSDIISNGAEGF